MPGPSLMVLHRRRKDASRRGVQYATDAAHCPLAKWLSRNTPRSAVRSPVQSKKNSPGYKSPRTLSIGPHHIPPMGFAAHRHIAVPARRTRLPACLCITRIALSSSCYLAVFDASFPWHNLFIPHTLLTWQSEFFP